MQETKLENLALKTITPPKTSMIPRINYMEYKIDETMLSVINNENNNECNSIEITKSVTPVEATIKPEYILTTKKNNNNNINNNINRAYPNFVKRQSTFDEDIDLSDGTLQIRLKDIPRFTYKKRDVYTLIEATLIKVNIGEQTFDCEIKFEFYWQQPELRKILNKKENQNRQFTIYDDQESIPIDLDDPFAGDMGLEVIEQEYRWDKRHNVVCLLLSVTDTFSERMELERFPCDRQFLNILLKGRIEYFNWLTIKPDWLNHIKCEHQITTIKGPSVSEYLVLPPWADFRVLDLPNEKLPPFKIRFRIQRLPHYYIGNVITPLILIIACCFSSLTIDMTDTADRLSVSITLMLAAVAFRFVLAEMLPTLPYLTWMDNYTTFSFGVVALFIFENSITVYPWINERYPRFDRIFGFTIGGILILVNGFFLIAMLTDWFKKSWEKMDVEDRESDDSQYTQHSDPSHVLGDDKVYIQK